uniref:Aminopeptidase P N-terminal domain-containing protein n=1 Tax=Arion vulgaris TaxID=1028688 RepID=A0A0B7AMT0_9EUPU
MLHTACVALFILFTVQTNWSAASSIADRLNCEPGHDIPATRVNTTESLTKFRQALANIKVNNSDVVAYIVLTGDAHNSEYPTDHDQRRAYISGFHGSAGTAVITRTKAALWTDGRYFLEAEETLDCNWIIMKSGLPDTPSYAKWLDDQIENTGSYVGVDRTLIPHTSFNNLKNDMQKLPHQLQLQAIRENPVDEAWKGVQPEQPRSNINALKLSFAGVSWQDKVKNLRANLTSKGVSAFVVTSLDEIAWLFNLRGSDILYNPFFLSYAIVEHSRVRLYIIDKDIRLKTQPSDSETNVTLAQHLGTSNTGSCQGKTELCVEVLNYIQNEIETALTSITSTGKVWITYDANYAIYLATETNQTIDKSPIALQKSQKNKVERAGMQKAYNRDSAALVKFLAFLENEIKTGKYWTEVTASTELDNRRLRLEYNRGLSFDTISGYGSNGAIIHYRPGNITDKVISTDSLYLLDSGGQYLDGTTDVTRTIHFGNPTSYHKECYTRVLMASINLAILKWPQGLYGRQIDAIARASLWEVGLVYRHGTGHGIGAYLSVHEGPGRIRMTTAVNPSEEKLTAHQYFSDEPGYYEDGKFGIRLETIVMVNPYTPKYLTANEQFYEFKPITFVPFETNLIDHSLLNAKQVNWLNNYNAETRYHILPLLAGDQRAINWLNSRTQEVRLESTNRDLASQMYIPSIFSLAFLALFIGQIY